MAAGMGELRAALATSGHGTAVCALLDTLATPKARADSPLPAAWSAYALEGLAQLVFLRETARFPSVAIGALVLGLGPVVASWHAHDQGVSPKAGERRIPGAFGEPLTAWFRIMLQTDAFQRLLPTPDALDELVGALLESTAC
jgi:hypothetical protein